MYTRLYRTSKKDLAKYSVAFMKKMSLLSRKAKNTTSTRIFVIGCCCCWCCCQSIRSVRKRISRELCTLRARTYLHIFVHMYIRVSPCCIFFFLSVSGDGEQRWGCAGIDQLFIVIISTHDVRARAARVVIIYVMQLRAVRSTWRYVTRTRPTCASATSYCGGVGETQSRLPYVRAHSRSRACVCVRICMNVCVRVKRERNFCGKMAWGKGLEGGGSSRWKCAVCIFDKTIATDLACARG